MPRLQRLAAPARRRGRDKRPLRARGQEGHTHMQTIARRARRLSPQTALLLALLVVIGTLALLSAPGNWLGRRLGVGAAPGHGLLVQRGAGACGGSGAAPTATSVTWG